jgi:hypothetical protein
MERSEIPPIDQRLGQFAQKTRWPLHHVTGVSGGRPHERVTEVEFVFRAGDRDIKQPAFFLFAFGPFEERAEEASRRKA